MKSMDKRETVKYLVTGAFGFNSTGDILLARLVAQDNDSGLALLYHPKDKDSCASYELARQNKDGLYVSVDPDLYVNVEPVVSKENHLL